MANVVKNRPVAIVAIGLTSLGLFSTAPGQAQIRLESAPLEAHVPAITDRLVGQMRTMTPGTATSPPVTVEMTTCLVSVVDAPTGSASRYLYQEQVILETGATPYRQRFLRLAPHARSQSVESLSYKPVELTAWAGFCDRPLAERQIAAADLGEPICSVFLRPVRDEYWGRTPIDGCPTEVRGAVRSTNTIRLHLVGMDTWDRGFNENDEQVWGAGDRPYEFRWSDR